MRAHVMDCRARLRVDIGIYMRTIVWATSGALMLGPCASGSPEMLTVAHMALAPRCGDTAV